MTVSPAFCPLSLQTLFDQNGCPIQGGRLTFYDAETTNARAVYKDQGLVTAHTSPVLTDSYGRVPPIWIGLGDYKVVIKDAVDGLIASIDDLPGGVTVTPAETTSSQVATGMVIAAHGTSIYDGWLPLNAETIGNANSTATARANVDTNALFVFLWNGDASLVVSGGRGISASADWAAAKTISLPDYRGKALVGVDGMGSALAGVLTTASTPTPDVIGTIVGSETETVSVEQLPAFSPNITITNAGAHIHTGSTDVQGAHQHGGTTDTNPGHVHSYQLPPILNGTSGGGFGSVGGYNTASTATSGVHSHAITTDTQGAHQHAVTTASAGDHTHIATSAPIGQGQGHPNVQPSILGYWHIKL